MVLESFVPRKWEVTDASFGSVNNRNESQIGVTVSVERPWDLISVSNGDSVVRAMYRLVRTLLRHLRHRRVNHIFRNVDVCIPSV